jgi:hypothetical protein
VAAFRQKVMSVGCGISNWLLRPRGKAPPSKRTAAVRRKESDVQMSRGLGSIAQLLSDRAVCRKASLSNLAPLGIPTVFGSWPTD